LASIAFIGPDGAGKTTISRMLEKSSVLPFKYFYMGINIDTSNVALPTARFVQYVKRLLHRDSGVWGGASTSISPPRKAKGRLWAAARLVNLLADEWYRQLLCRYYEMRGYIILCDRHFVFDFADEIAADRNESLSHRLHRWCLARLYPRPNLVIYLDAPAGVLFARKGELTVEELERRRKAFIRQGNRLPNFIRVDATQPLEKVYAEVAVRIMEFYGRHKGLASSQA